MDTKTITWTIYQAKNGKSKQKSVGTTKKGCLKRTTETLIMAVEQHAVRTNNIKAKIDKTQQNSKCRICKKAEKSVNHVLSECSKLAQREYKRQHDWFRTIIHWEICRKYRIEVK